MHVCFIICVWKIIFCNRMSLIHLLKCWLRLFLALALQLQSSSRAAFLILADFLLLKHTANIKLIHLVTCMPIDSFAASCPVCSCELG